MKNASKSLRWLAFAQNQPVLLLHGFSINVQNDRFDILFTSV